MANVEGWSSRMQRLLTEFVPLHGRRPIILFCRKGPRLLRRFLILISIIPGTGPILLGRELAGALLLFIGLNAWNLVFLSHWLVGNVAVICFWVGWSAGISSSVISVLWTAVLTSTARRRRIREFTDRAFRAGMVAHLRGKDAEARTAVEAGLRMQADDADLCFLDWVLALKYGGRRRAYPRLRRLRRADREEKWIWEIRRAEELKGR